MRQASQNSIHQSFTRKSRYTGFTSGWVDQKKQNGLVRLLKKLDVFSFLPVPVDQPVSTRRSLIGTALILLIFFTYIIFDLVSFLIYNPGIGETYYTKLDATQYQIPRFAFTFMFGEYLNKSDTWDQFLNYSLTREIRNPGFKSSENLQLNIYQFNNDSEEQNIEDLKWLDYSYQNFYSTLFVPKQRATTKGLLYSMNNSQFTKIMINLCDYKNQPGMCVEEKDIVSLLAGGRLFLFIENTHLDATTDIAADQNENKFLLQNFFCIPYTYKRVTINFIVQKVVIQPDYFWRWTKEKHTRLKVYNIMQDLSDVSGNYNENQTVLQTLSISFQLHHEILNTKITYATSIDKVSMWGALWGVLFFIFAFYFLTYNREKYYRKNPDWGNFKKVLDVGFDKPPVILTQQ